MFCAENETNFISPYFGFIPDLKKNISKSV